MLVRYPDQRRSRRRGGSCDATHLAVDEGEDVEGQAAEASVDGAGDALDGGLDGVDAGAERAGVVLGEAVQPCEAHHGLRRRHLDEVQVPQLRGPPRLLLHNNLALLLWTAHQQIRPKPHKTKSSINLRIQVRIEARSAGKDHAYRLLRLGVGLLLRHRANRTGGWVGFSGTWSGNRAAGRGEEKRTEEARRDDSAAFASLEERGDGRAVKAAYIGDGRRRRAVRCMTRSIGAVEATPEHSRAGSPRRGSRDGHVANGVTALYLLSKTPNCILFVVFC